MPRTLIVLSFLALLVTGVGFADQTRLTVINRSTLPIAVRLNGLQEEEFYYLRVPAGERFIPAEKDFTIIKDIYRAQIYYIETYDPVYGFECPGSLGSTVNAYHVVRMVVNDCHSLRPLRGGEPRRRLPGGP